MRASRHYERPSSLRAGEAIQWRSAFSRLLRRAAPRNDDPLLATTPPLSATRHCERTLRHCEWAKQSRGNAFSMTADSIICSPFV
ncbi:MAG: hypothetical protein LBT00_04105 [Spirochaetaceae bacterium]|nr:hypothetical protein [Spirochaetaceae bacterium]